MWGQLYQECELLAQCSSEQSPLSLNPSGVSNLTSSRSRWTTATVAPSPLWPEPLVILYFPFICPVQAVASQDMCTHGSYRVSFSCCCLHERQIGGHNLRQVPELIQGNCLTRGGHLLLLLPIAYQLCNFQRLPGPNTSRPSSVWVLPDWKFMLLHFLLPPEVAFLIVSLHVVCHKSLILNVLNTQRSFLPVVKEST